MRSGLRGVPALLTCVIVSKLLRSVEVRASKHVYSKNISGGD